MAKMMFLAKKGLVECSRKECEDLDVQNIRGYENPAKAIQDGWAIYKDDWVCPSCAKDLMSMVFATIPESPPCNCGMMIGDRKDIVISINEDLDIGYIHQIEQNIDEAIGCLGFSRSGTTKGDGKTELIYFRFAHAYPRS